MIGGEITGFQWEVHRAYRWVRPESAETAHDYSLEPVSEPSDMPRYIEPLKSYPSLFRNFAFTKPDHSGFLEFAHRYGLLENSRSVYSAQLGRPEKVIYHNQQYRRWLHYWQELRLHIDIWDAAQRGDAEFLSTCFDWEEGTLLFTWPMEYQRAPDSLELPSSKFLLYEEPEVPVNPRHEVLSDTYHRSILSSFHNGDLVKPAQIYCSIEIGEKIGQVTENTIIYDMNIGKFSICIMPVSLIGAMWLQFAWSIAENRRHYKCEYCSTWFEPQRSTKRYCSETCKSKAYQARKESSTGHSAGSEKD